MDEVNKLYKAILSSDFMATINGTSKRQIECREKSKFHYVKESYLINMGQGITETLTNGISLSWATRLIMICLMVIFLIQLMRLSNTPTLNQTPL